MVTVRVLLDVEREEDESDDDLLARLSDYFKPLSPLGDSSGEWCEVLEMEVVSG